MNRIALVLAVVLAIAVGWFFMVSDAAEMGRGEPRPAAIGEPTAPTRSATPGVEPRREVVGAPGAAAESPAPPAGSASDSTLGSLELSVVFRRDGRPAPSVRILLLAGAGGWDDRRVFTTDRNGVVRIDRLRPGSVFVQVLRGGEQSFTIRANETTRATLSVLPGVTLAVQVVDPDGAPVADATVWLSERWRNNRGRPVGRTDAGGGLTLPDVSPHCSVAVRCEGFEPSKLFPVKGPVGGQVRIRVDLRRGGGMVGGVVVDPRGEPVPGAMVLIGAEKPEYDQRAEDGGWIPGPPPVLRVTDEAGRFVARAVPAGSLPVRVRHEDHAPWQGEVESSPGAPVDLRIVLERGATIFGVVTGVDGAPVAGARVWVGELESFTGRMVHTGTDGRYELPGLSGGEQKVRAARRDQRTEAVLRIATGERMQWDPVLAADRSDPDRKVLEGTVVDHRGQPLAGWRVAARAAGIAGRTVSTNTDGAGGFRLQVEWDELFVWTHAPGGHREYPALVRDRVRVADGRLLLRVEDPRLRSAVVRGAVVDTAGRPVQARVQSWHTELRLWREFSTDAKTGGFEIDNIPPGAIELKVVTESHAWKQIPRMTLVAGETADLGRIVLQPGGRILGSLTVQGGGAVRDARVSVYHADGGEAAVATVADRSYRTGILAAGSYLLQVMGEWVATIQVPVTMAAADVTKDLVLQPAALRVVSFDLEEGVARPRFLNVLVRSDRGLAWSGGFGDSGELRCRISVAPGEYTLFVWGPDRKNWLEARISVADMQDAPPLRFTLRPR